MKKVLLFIVVSLLLIACGKDGEDGKAYLSFDWDWYVDTYSDDNPDTPRTITKNQKYRVYPGTYSFTYHCSDGAGNYWYYDGTYSIYINKGEEGGFLVDGEDGADIYFKLNMYGDGYYFNHSSSKNKVLKERLSNVMQYDIADFNVIDTGIILRDTVYSGNSYMIVTLKKYELK